MHELKSSHEESEKVLDETVDGATEDFDLIEMDNQVHEYTKAPIVLKVEGTSAKQRTIEDENTKQYMFRDKGIRSTSDTGGNRLDRGIENHSFCSKFRQKVSCVNLYVYRKN